MSRAIAAIVISAALAAVAGPAAALERLYLVRHAEKVEHWPDGPVVRDHRPLSERGIRRAQALAELLARQGIAAIYVSPTTRAIATGAPLSLQSGAPIVSDERTVRVKKMAAFVKQLGRRHRADRAVLIVGHSNTIPFLLRSLGATSECEAALDIRAASGGWLIDGYDDLWIVSWPGGDCSSIERRDFEPEPSPGSPSPR